MSTPHETALHLAVLRLVADMVKDARSVADEATGQALEEGDRITATLGGHKLAAVSMAAGSTRCRVVDEDKLAAWVEQNYPTEVEYTVRVRPVFLKQLQDAAKKAGAPVDPTTGEEIPGLEVTTGEPHPTVRPVDGARDILADAWQRGELTLGEVLQLPGGEQ